MEKKKREIQTADNLLGGVERLFMQVMIGLVPPVFFFLLGWWGSLPFAPEESIKFFALGGLALGLFIDILFMRRWLPKAYSLPVGWFVAFYLFYSIAMFGFFMGVPIFNLILGAVGGYYVGICLRYADKDKGAVERSARRTAFFTAGVLAVACIASWVIASLDASLAANIQGMFNLSKAISRENILLFSVSPEQGWLPSSIS
jgi:hypothetical protein